jgi:hypothetical protein
MGELHAQNSPRRENATRRAVLKRWRKSVASQLPSSVTRARSEAITLKIQTLDIRVARQQGQPVQRRGVRDFVPNKK